MLTFPELGLGEKVLKAIDALGFKEPTPIQQQAIPLLLKDKSDFIGLAQTGTGKTAAFGLPLIEKINFNSTATQALILAPTRELCMQITEDLIKFAKFTQGANIVPVYGGASITTQMRQLKRGAQIVVATPGRLIDMIGKKALTLATIKFVVLDEADEMLNMGFQEDIDDILSTTPKEKNVWLFSATMPSEVRTISANYMKNPAELTVGKQNSGADNLEHFYYVVHERDRYIALRRILDSTPEIFGVVFCRTKLDTQRIAENLIKDGYNADALHGDLSQQQRDKVMNRYRNRSLQVLVATDVAARGIDVQDISHVIHNHLPDEIENYTHRSGRTARAGKSGISIVLVNMKEIYKIRQIEKKLNKKFHLGKIPDAVDIGEQQLLHFIRKIHTVEVNEKGLAKYLEPVYKEFEGLTKEEIIKRIVSLEFNRFLNDYRNAPNLNVDIAHQGKSSADRPRFGAPRMFVNVGSVDGFDKGKLLGYILELTGLQKEDIGRIDIKPVYSFVEIEKEENMEKALKSFTDEFHNGRPVRVEKSGEAPKKDFGKKDFGKKDFSKGKKSWSDKPPRKGDFKPRDKSEQKSGQKKKKYNSGW